MQPLCRCINHVDDGILALAVPDAVDLIVQILLIESVKRGGC